MSTKRQKCEHKKIFWMENLKTVAQPEESLTFNSMNSKNHKHGFAFQMIDCMSSRFLMKHFSLTKREKSLMRIVLHYCKICSESSLTTLYSCLAEQDIYNQTTQKLINI